MPAPLVLGWEEWVALPDLGLPAIKAKVDTGARTSALHAASIEPFGPHSAPMVRFVVHPHPARADIEITCSAPVVGRRDVTSSNGERETRFVIETSVLIAGRRWPIEVTLTNRETMSYRMLLGRQAIGAEMVVEPGASFRQPRLSYRPYRSLPRRDLVRRPLRIAVITRRPEAASSRRLCAAAAARGHVMELIDPRSATLTFRDGEAGVSVDGTPLGHYDAIVPRLAGGSGGQVAALVRQLEMMGGYALNPADALERMQHPMAVLQSLVRAGVGRPPARISPGAHAEAVSGALPEEALRLLVVDHKVVAAASLHRGRLRAMAKRPPVKARRAARRATRALRLGLAGVEVAMDGERFAVVSVTAAPLLSQFERLARTDVAAPIIAAIESHVRSWARRSTDSADPGSAAG